MFKTVCLESELLLYNNNNNNNNCCSSSSSSKETDSEVGPMKCIVGITAQRKCLLTPVRESMLKYLKLKSIDFFFSKRRKVISAIKS